MTRKKNELIRSSVHYFGTSLGGGFFGRYKAEKFYERGSGELWLTNNALYFRRFLTMDKFAFKIPINAITDISSGHAIAGKISLPPILKIHWEKDDETLVSGFSIPRKVAELSQWQLKLTKVMKAKLK